jgi:hypothetical protein
VPACLLATVQRALTFIGLTMTMMSGLCLGRTLLPGHDVQYDVRG